MCVHSLPVSFKSDAVNRNFTIVTIEVQLTIFRCLNHILVTGLNPTIRMHAIFAVIIIILLEIVLVNPIINKVAIAVGILNIL